MADVTFTVDGKKLTAPAGTLLIDACRKAGIEIPAFCYYPGLSLQAACRMCLVRQEKVPKLQTACTTQVAEGQVFITDSDEITQARRATLELLLGNHPLDCPVCDAGGECELQDMTFKYGAGESLYAEAKHHREEQQWSPAVFYDRPRCILCYRCIRVCGEAMDVWALGIQNRGTNAVIAPNLGHALDCEQCGMCIDICPVGALTSGTYRYKTRPWEMHHVSTVCTHCADGCKVTLGIRPAIDGSAIVRADNRDKSGINGDFLCAKGRFGFDFVESPERITKPLVRNSDGKLEPATWEHALQVAAGKLKAVRDARGGQAIGVIGSYRATNEENYLLQKFARTVLNTNHIDHERSADYATFARALAGHTEKAASLRAAATAPAIMLIGGNPTEEHPLLAWTLRNNVRLNRARLYIFNDKPIKLIRQAKEVRRLTDGGYHLLASYLGGNRPTDIHVDIPEKMLAEESLLVIFGAELQGEDLQSLISWGLQRSNVKFACISDYVNSRGAADMGLLPDFLPGYFPVTAPGNFATEYAGLPSAPGKALSDIFDAAARDEIGALLIMSADPVARLGLPQAALKNTAIVAIDLFLTETAARADVVLPAESLYEKTGTVTNAFGDVQLVKKGADSAGVKSEFEILVRLAGSMGVDVKTLVPFETVSKSGVSADLGQSRGVQAGEADRHAVWLEANGLEPKLSPFDPFAMLDEIERLVPGYTLDRLNLFGGIDIHIKPDTAPGFVPITALTQPEVITPLADSFTEATSAHDGLFTSGTLGRYSKALQELQQHQAHIAAATQASEAKGK
jgi:NADH-quinone oxidoreductase subunit G